MHSPSTGRPAGRIDLVLANSDKNFIWFGLEIQAVYFSGTGMRTEFERLVRDADKLPPARTQYIGLIGARPARSGSCQVSQDLDEGDIIWLVPQISDEYRLEALHCRLRIPATSNTPGFIGWLEMTAQSLLEFRPVALNPSPDRSVVSLQAAFIE